MTATVTSPIISYTLDRIDALRVATKSATIRRRCELALCKSVGLKVRCNAITMLCAYMDGVAVEAK